jgi:hypothetical protein
MATSEKAKTVVALVTEFMGKKPDYRDTGKTGWSFKWRTYNDEEMKAGVLRDYLMDRGFEKATGVTVKKVDPAGGPFSSYGIRVVVKK